MSAFTFIDLFAGAGGFSEGFLQAEQGGVGFQFLLASDVNENCELTHVMRYNEQLGLPARFLCKSITDDDFIPELLACLTNPVTGRVHEVDVVCGGPPCQSFSLAGRRRANDKKDDLFAYYLKVIAKLRPKYFVMENVMGLLTKDGGSIPRRIREDVAAIVDNDGIQRARAIARRFLGSGQAANETAVRWIFARLEMAVGTQSAAESMAAYAQEVGTRFKQLCAKHLSYETSKTDPDVLTVRHGLALFREGAALHTLRRQLMQLKSDCDVDRDAFVGAFDTFLDATSTAQLVTTTLAAANRLASRHAAFAETAFALELLAAGPEFAITQLRKHAEKTSFAQDLESLANGAESYTLSGPFVLNAADFGVPQERRRVVFVGCRKDQPVVKNIRPTVALGERVTAIEALADLDFVANGQTATRYDRVPEAAHRLAHAQPRRRADGRIDREGKTYAEWCREGRLGGRFPVGRPIFRPRVGAPAVAGELHNHQVSRHNADVEARYAAIHEHGTYDAELQGRLSGTGSASKKRDYTLIKPDAPSSTILTIPDDFVHYRMPRALTVREMARLQSFDDSFVFQGKRTTGGDLRKLEVPQFTLVGNAIPPLLARGIASEILLALVGAKQASPDSTAK